MNGQNIIIDKLQGTFLMTVPLAAVKDTLTIPLMASFFELSNKAINRRAMGVAISFLVIECPAE